MTSEASAILCRVQCAHRLSSVDRRALGALPPDSEPGLWLTAAGLAIALDVADEVAAGALGRLLWRQLVRDDDQRPRAFARTLYGEVVLTAEVAVSGDLAIEDLGPRPSGGLRCVRSGHTTGPRG